jgi:hypothetical protein
VSSNADDGRTAAPKRGRRRSGPHGIRLAPGPIAPYRRNGPPDEYTLYLRENTAAYVTSTTVMPPNPNAPESSCALARGLRDPDYECEHGRLPGDRTDPCGCWAGEPAAGAGNGGAGANGLRANPLPLSQAIRP